MKKKDKATMMSMKPQELSKAILETEKKLADFRVFRYSKQSKNVREGRSLKNKITVLKTAQRMEEIAHE